MLNSVNRSAISPNFASIDVQYTKESVGHNVAKYLKGEGFDYEGTYAFPAKKKGVNLSYDTYKGPSEEAEIAAVSGIPKQFPGARARRVDNEVLSTEKSSLDALV